MNWTITKEYRMNCIHREILKKGNADSARLFSVCTCDEYKKLLNADEHVKIRNPLVCDDCPHRVSTSPGTNQNRFGFGDHTEV
jgi:TPP-dependent indolepyruvate ferredoxin oxidoreductase alpha subunit